jgi:hypothetical protein
MTLCPASVLRHRKTGYKIFERYQECGFEGLSDRTRRPFRYANQLPEQIEAAIVTARRNRARKIRERLLRSLPHGIKVPACSTIHAVLDRHGLVTHPIRSRTRAHGTALSEGLSSKLMPTNHPLAIVNATLLPESSHQMNLIRISCTYPSLRSATTGSTRAARHAGTPQAIKTAMASTTIAPV